MTQFRRSASVTIGPPSGEGLLIKDLKIVFEVTRNLEKTPNTVKVQIYNLSRSTRNKIDLALPKDKAPAQKLLLKAGYLDGDGEETLFLGDITSISHISSMPNIVTTIESQDGIKSIAATKANLSFGKGVRGKVVLDSILDLFENPKDLANVTIPNSVYDTGFAFIGPATTVLSKVTNFLGLEWSFQNDTLKLLNFDSNDGSRIVFLSSSTGLLNSPEKVNRKLRKSRGVSKKVIPGWKFFTFLEPKIIPGGNISVQSNEIPKVTVFKVNAVSHNGDTHGEDWNTTIEVDE